MKEDVRPTRVSPHSSTSKDPYADMYDLPHHRSTTHPHMTIADRAAQFAPFAALTGHASAIAETARRTEERPEPDEDCKALLNQRLGILLDHLAHGDMPQVSITYFQPDDRKAGGRSCTCTHKLKKASLANRTLLMSDETLIPIDDILSIEGDLFKDFPVL